MAVFTWRALPSAVRRRVATTRAVRQLRIQWQARRLATGAKRLDLCAAQVAMLFHLAGGPSVEGRVCLELGSGWVLSHTLVLYLLGARNVIASDVTPLAHPGVLRRAVQRAEPSVVRDVLSPFADRAGVRARLDTLLSIERFSFRALRRLGIEYRAPLDLTRAPLAPPVHLIYSNAVLEHVPVCDLPLLLANLARSLAPGGMMLHAVHLEDHSDPARSPFAFLTEPAARFTTAQQTARGNRLRRDAWLALLESVEGMEWQILYQWERTDRPLPPTIDRSVRYTDENDLRVSHLGIFGVKRG